MRRPNEGEKVLLLNGNVQPVQIVVAANDTSGNLVGYIVGVKLTSSDPNPTFMRVRAARKGNGVFDWRQAKSTV